MKLPVLASALAATLLIAAPAVAQDAAPASAAPAAPSSAAAATTGKSAPTGSLVIEAPPAGKGRIVFFRPSATGMLIGCAVHENGATLSRLPNGKYFVNDFDPGVHTFLVESESKDTLRMEVEAGETYYVKCSIAMGIMMGRPNLSPSDKDTFDRKSKGLHLQDPPAPKAS